MRHDRQRQHGRDDDRAPPPEPLRQRAEHHAADRRAHVVDHRDPGGGRRREPGAAVVGGLQERRVDVLGAVAHPVERRHEQDEVAEAAQHRRVEQHVAERRAAHLHLLAGVLPHRGLLDAGADEQADQRRDDRQREQPPPGQAQPGEHHQRRERGQQVAQRVALLEHAGEEPAPRRRDLLHGERRAQPPLAAHADPVEQAQHQQHREVRGERAEEPDDRVEAHVDEQRDPPARPVGPHPEDHGPDRAHHQRRGREERHLRQRDAELLRDLGVDEHDQEVVERVHHPAEQRGDERVALIRGERLPLCHVGGRYARTARPAGWKSLVRGHIGRTSRNALW